MKTHCEHCGGLLLLAGRPDAECAFCRETNRLVRERSGMFTSNEPLVSFLYELMRDHMLTGEVEGLVRRVNRESGPQQFTNGWLAQYAGNLADRLQPKPAPPPQALQLLRDLRASFLNGDMVCVREVLTSDACNAMLRKIP